MSVNIGATPEHPASCRMQRERCQLNEETDGIDGCLSTEATHGRG